MPGIETRNIRSQIRGTEPRYSASPLKTSRDVLPEANDRTDESDKAVDWLNSGAARHYEGRWVALDRETGQLLDAARSPLEFDAQVWAARAVIIFVPRSGVLHL